MKATFLSIFIIIFCLNNTFAQTAIKSRPTSANDSLIQKYSKDIDELKIETRLLKDKVETLNSVNDKILNSIYWTIGSIITTILGLTIWNSIKNRSLNEEKFKIALESSKNDLSKTLSIKLSESIKNVSFSEISSLKSSTTDLKSDLNNLKIFLYILHLKSHPFWNIYDEGYLFENYFNFVVNSKIKSEYKYLLETIINFIKSKSYLSLDDKSKILNFIEGECSSDSYKVYVDQIKKSLESFN